MSVALGTDLQTGNTITLGDTERGSGLYVLGKPGMGKSTLLVNMIDYDMLHGNSVFFLDPHGEAISDLIHRSFAMPVAVKYEKILLLDPTDEDYSFGINLLSCPNVSSLKARHTTYTRAHNVFQKLFENERGDLGVWLELIIQNTLPVFIENQGYTLAEIPLFLTDEEFRKHLLQNVQYETEVLDFWQREFQPKQAESAITRMRRFLGNAYIRHIVGQKNTTIDFTKLVIDPPKFVFVRLPAELSTDIKKFIGTILISELLHAIRTRPVEARKRLYGVYVDEFQHFAVYEDMASLITEGRKFGCAFCGCHQERYGQVGENQKILGATQACANKVLFQLTPRDAKEFAPEFADAPIGSEIRREPVLVISQQPVWDLLRHGHADPQIQEFFYKYIHNFKPHMDALKEAMEKQRLKISQTQFLASMFQSEASYSRLDNSAGMLMRPDAMTNVARSNELSNAKIALENAKAIRNSSQEDVRELMAIYGYYFYLLERIQNTETFLTAVMEGRSYLRLGNEQYAQFFIDLLFNRVTPIPILNQFHLYLSLRFGDPSLPRVIPAIIAVKLFPKELEEKHWQDRLEYRNQYRQETEENAKRQIAMGKHWYSEYDDAYFAKLLQEDFQTYVLPLRAGKIKICPHSNRPLIRVRDYDVNLPDLSPRILSQQERERVMQFCQDSIIEAGSIRIDNLTALSAIEELIEFCNLLTKPENHIKVPSGQYTERLVNIRPVSDMTNEMIQKLADLPRFTAYTKIITEEHGEQVTLKAPMKTPSRIAEPKGDYVKHFIGIEEQITALTRRVCCQPRTAIEEELRKRRESWKKPVEVQPPEMKTPEKKPQKINWDEWARKKCPEPKKRPPPSEDEPPPRGF